MNPKDFPENPPPGTEELDLQADALQQLLEMTGKRLADFISSLPEQPTDSSALFDPEAGWLKDHLPDSPSDSESLLDFLFDEVIPAAYNPASPGYLAYVPGGGLFSAALGELIAGTVNRYTGCWASAPAAVELETQAIRWLAEMMGMPEGSLGVLTSGASISTLIALVAAREKYLGEELHRGVIYTSNEIHHSIPKAARIAGLPERNLRQVAVDEKFRMRPGKLQEAIEADRDAGLLPFFVCSSAGTVNTGSIDPLEEIARVATAEGLWHHVDGAYGAAFHLVPELAGSLKGMALADSLAVDPHKGLFLAYGTGALLVRDMAPLREAFQSSASYMPDMQTGEHYDFCEFTPELSRQWRGLRLWLPLKLHGVDAFRRSLSLKRELALRAWEHLNRRADIEIPVEPDLSLFIFRQRHDDCTPQEEDARNQALLERINRPQRVMLTGTVVNDRFYLRLCILHLRTDHARLDEALSIIDGALEENRRD
ncbi:MAG: aminotransferase class V-fold PLP-dependent enzyme [Planctomycetota bacterium]